MSKFIKSEFSVGEYATYGGKFVARFKRGGRASFLNFLCSKFTVEEYFAQLDRGQAPLKILESKGYVAPQFRKFLKEGGYPISLEGLSLMINARIDAKAIPWPQTAG